MISKEFVGFEKFQRLRDNMALILSGGNCNNFSKCHHGIADYPKFDKIQNEIFILTTNSKLDCKNIKSYLETNSWRFILGVVSYESYKMNKQVKCFLDMFGIEVSDKTFNGDLQIYGNLCK